MKIGAWLGYVAFRGATTFLSLIPWSWAYKISDFFTWMLIHVFKYRYKVMNQNIRLCFPAYTNEQVDNLVHKNYQHLADLLVESLKGFGMSKAAFMERFEFTNGPELKKALSEKQQCIVCTGHMANFEWGAIVIPLYLDLPFAGFYKPLKNPYIDKAIRKQRNKLGTDMVSIYGTQASFEKYKDGPIVFGMMADQSPSNLKKAIWTNFFNIEVPCLAGIDTYARAYDMPVFYIYGGRISRGQYKAHFSLLTDRPNDMPAEALIHMYMHELEGHIKEKPEQWLWTHKRFKHAKLSGKE